MIGMISGKVVYLSAPQACIMTTSGVGYEVELPVPSFCTLALDAEATIYTHLHVREDAQLLFGFAQKQERDVFRKLIKINGVGAKMALAILSTLSADALKRAVDMDDDSALVSVPGIGKKTAQRLLIELKGKLNEFGQASDFGGQGEFFDSAMSGTSVMHAIAEAESALISLGYKEKEAQNAIKKVQPELDVMDTQSLLKAALKQLSGF
ncbi:Holliday junction branch migration protein RuvA [Moraxella caviae]|uniref:Holliday junction branch migration complex subunit RuvA n=1 Tax=Moraxella caviae TaxID=34060 RepID=A0A1T0A3S8_9GAMM|nr:Holliday junction branch migration protein RuvA [Moraxella caviae]OOR90219.1 Holliday junction branch migration protein RuvA [Moraxella caviae]STZ14561.1 Holliday junction ATP-dependent DNA helicase RuvA [Moraxella caviae]VEW12566.1 Holliday junction ATP-dependent DNA helicase RuvA [Moraxella caviae]